MGLEQQAELEDFRDIVRRDLGQDLVAEEWKQVNTQLPIVAGDIFSVPLARDQRDIFDQEGLGDVLEQLAALQDSGAGLAAQFQIPILGDLFRVS